MRKLVLIALCLALFLPGAATAGAAPPPITAAAYRERLTLAADQLSRGQVPRARETLGEGWSVSTANGTYTVDLRPVLAQAQSDPAAAADAVRQHLAALRSLEAPAGQRQPLPEARERLTKALKDAESQQRANATLSDWFARLFERLFGGRRDPAARAEPDRQAISWLTYVALGVGVIGVGVLGWNLTRTLSANAAGEAVALGAGKKGARPGRPPTPDELWQQASAHAVAGDYKEGLRLAHLALLQHLDQVGLFRYIPAQTNREHEALLRRKEPALARLMHQLNDLVESRLYSGHGATADDFRQGAALAQQLWREGDVRSKSAQETTGASSAASSS